ncbi:hypothetical protein FS749_012944 [Ceratobasidium sp. UAMH 11750]|nr:hypothetical protein FS749_012944 [Ceratobasidium sp. UAMH 11750]
MMPKSTTRGGDNLPLDLLSLIFTMIVHSAASARYAGDKRYGSIDYPILLASVCSYWRPETLHGALNTPNCTSSARETCRCGYIWGSCFANQMQRKE